MDSQVVNLSDDAPTTIYEIARLVGADYAQSAEALKTRGEVDSMTPSPGVSASTRRSEPCTKLRAKVRRKGWETSSIRPATDRDSTGHF
jgi:hypothetical protein